MMKHQRSDRGRCAIFAAAAATSLAGGRVSQASLTFDLRFPDGSKTQAISAGTSNTFPLELWAQVSGTDANHGNDGLSRAYATIQSAGGDFTWSGGITAGAVQSPFNFSSRNGSASIITPDSLTDWGGTGSTLADTNYLLARSLGNTAAGAAVGHAVDSSTWEFKIASFTLSLNNLSGYWAGPVSFSVARPAATTNDGIAPATYATYTQDGVSSTLSASNAASAYGSAVTVRAGAIWTGAISEFWSDSGNWSTGVVPGYYDAAIVGRNGSYSTLSVTGSIQTDQVIMSADAVRDTTVQLFKDGQIGATNGASHLPAIVNEGHHTLFITGPTSTGIGMGGGIDVLQPDGVVDISLPISHVRNVSLDKNGPGTLTLRYGATSNTESYYIHGGTFNVYDTQGQFKWMDVFTDAGTTFNLYGVLGDLSFLSINGSASISADQSIGQLAGSGSIALNGHALCVGAGYTSPSSPTATFTGSLSAVDNFTKAGTTTQILRSLRAGSLTVTGGRLIMNANGGASGVSYVGGLSIGPGGTIDLNDNDLVVQYGTSATPFTTINQKIIGGVSDDPGNIISTTGRSTGNTIHYAIDNALVGLTEWPLDSGISIDPNSVIAKYTYFGDVNLDGAVDASDYGIVDGGFGSTPAPGVAVVLGDANLDGFVDNSDYGIIDGNFGQGTGNRLAPASQAVPEPICLSLTLATAIVLFPRRRRPPE